MLVKRALVVAGVITPVLVAGTVPAAAAGPVHVAATSGPDHVVVVLEENRNLDDVIGSSDAPYLNSLAGQGVLYTNDLGKTHPSLPNYIDLYSGSTQGQDGNDDCVQLSAPNLGTELADASLSVKEYAQSLGSADPTQDNGSYACRHNPLAQFTDSVSTSSSVDFSAFPSDFTQLPTLSFVTPDVDNDMHDGSVSAGDTWLRNNIDAYAQWAKTHNSVLIVTWDENAGDDLTTPLPQIVVGAGVTQSQQTATVNHDSTLRSIEDWYGLPALADSAGAGDLPGLPSFREGQNADRGVGQRPHGPSTPSPQRSSR